MHFPTTDRQLADLTIMNDRGTPGTGSGNVNNNENKGNKWENIANNKLDDENKV